MCGIAGIFEKYVDNRNTMSKMLDLISHRGPDNSSIFTSGDFCLGHRRLSIIDLNTGNQPIFNEDKSLAIIFNGEIYNYPELRDTLIKRGHKFQTNSDTEVIIHGFEEYGKSLFEKLNGIFAFAILDKNSNELILVRDHFGIKPLHYYFKENLFIFSSEQKAILLHQKVEKKLNYNSLHQQINLRYTQSEETLFANIKRLPPASFLSFKNNNITLKNYWKLESKINYSISETDAVDGINYYIKKAVQRQLISDVPVGVYLSGGMDSSTIVQKMNELGVEEINTFTLGFNEPTDEFSDAAKVASMFETNHRTMSLSFEPLKLLPEVIWHAEEPKINLLQGFNMSKFVQPHVKVVLGGLGGDELFAGYDIHKYVFPFKNISRIIPNWVGQISEFKSSLLFNMHDKIGLISFDEYRRGLQMLLSLHNMKKFYLILRNVWDFDNNFYKTIYHPNFIEQSKGFIKCEKYFDDYFKEVSSLNSLDQVLYAEFHSKMINDYLLVEDRMSMSHSIEERVPFLDLDLVNFAFSIPTEMKMKNNQAKYLFRKAMNGKLPSDIIYKKKWGFAVNPYLQFKKDLKSIAEKILTKEFIDKQGIFNYNYIEKILKQRPNPRLRWHYNFLWIVLAFAIMEKMYLSTDNFIYRRFDLNEYM